MSHTPPVDSKGAKVPVKWRTCACTDLVLGEGVIRAILEGLNPAWKDINKTPCTHWTEAMMKVPRKHNK